MGIHLGGPCLPLVTSWEDSLPTIPDSFHSHHLHIDPATYGYGDPDSGSPGDSFPVGYDFLEDLPSLLTGRALLICLGAALPHLDAD